MFLRMNLTIVMLYRVEMWGGTISFNEWNEPEKIMGWKCAVALSHLVHGMNKSI